MGYIKPSDAYNPKSQGEVEDQGDKVCAVCIGPKPCGCDPDNLDDRLKYFEASAGIVDSEDYPWSIQDIEDLTGPVTGRAIELAYRVFKSGIQIKNVPNLLYFRSEPTLPIELFGIKYGPYSRFGKIGLLCRFEFSPAPYGAGEEISPCTLEGVDVEDFDSVVGVSYQAMANIFKLHDRGVTFPRESQSPRIIHVREDQDMITVDTVQ